MEIFVPDKCYRHHQRKARGTIIEQMINKNFNNLIYISFNMTILSITNIGDMLSRSLLQKRQRK